MATADDTLGEEKHIFKAIDSLSTAAVIDSLKGDTSDEDRNTLIGGQLVLPPI